jgi:hypothetical protein
MREFKTVFLSVYEPVMSEMGFQRKRVIFHRLVNEKIIQMLSYTKFSGGSFTIQFSIFPLCGGCEYTTFMDDERLGSLLGNETYAEWENDGTETVAQMKESLDICEKHLFPVFERLSDYKVYYEYAIDKHQKEYAQINDEYKKLHADLLSFPHAVGFYELSLLFGNYDIVKKMQTVRIARNKDALESMTLTPPPERIQDFNDLCSDYSRMTEAMNANDREYIESYVKEKERYSLESYIKNFHGKKAFKEYQQNRQLP